MRAIILSAGLGERLRPLTLKRAKPAIEFLNVPTLGFPYYWLGTLRLKDVVFNTHYLPETIRHAAMHVVDPAVPMFFTHEEAILGSGGGIWNARTYLDQDDEFAVANGDGVILCEEPDVLEQMLDYHRRKRAFATILVCPLEGVGTRLPGVWTDNAGEVHGFGKVAPNSYATCLHYASYMIISREVWRYFPEGSSNILYDVFIAAMQDGHKVHGFRVDKMHWFETGNIPEYLAATKQCLDYMRADGPLGRCAHAILERLSPGYDLQERKLVASGAVVDKGANLQGYVVIGADSKVERGATVRDAVILPGATLGEGQSCVGEVLI